MAKTADDRNAYIKLNLANQHQINTLAVVVNISQQSLKPYYDKLL